MKIKKSQLKEIIREELSNVTLNEVNFREVTERDAKDFISDVLKLGSKANIFDVYMKKNKINPDDLFKLVTLVGKELLKF